MKPAGLTNCEKAKKQIFTSIKIDMAWSNKRDL